MSAKTERWLKLLGLGLIVWLIPLLVQNGLFFIQLYDKQAFYAAVVLVGLAVTLICLAVYLPTVRAHVISEGWMLAVIWLVMSLGLNLAFSMLTGTEGLDWLAYLASYGWLHLYIPVSTVSCAYLAHAVDARSALVVSGSGMFPIR